MLLEDLSKLFFETLAFRLSDLGQLNVLHEERMDSMVSTSSAVVKSKRDLYSYKQAKLATAKLVQVDLGHFLNSIRDGHMFFVKLANILCMHASIELELEMKDIAATHAQRIAYNIGNRLLTAQQLQSIL